ncbi:hypothetical protein HYC85_027959 [Camellia sinensis]|uniref:Uncharacterized protein n=1 Tax=Camellia sinensis TaxID=4442 RepID=A0A7J7FVT9_CAMSI|nr:hypothetical protein HYC85_027959 [Camellia sinensis]
MQPRYGNTQSHRHATMIPTTRMRQHAMRIPRIVEIVQIEFPINIHAPTPAMIKAEQNPTAPLTQGSQLPPVNLGSPTSSSSKPKSSKSKIKSKSAKPSTD